MRTAADIERTLKTAFPPEQASVLAEVVFESYDQLVKTSDFNELKGIVRELATAQQRTDEDLRKLTAQVAELSASHKELAASQKELTAAQNQTEKELRNLARQVGGLSEAFGGSLEDFAIDLVPELLEKYWGMVVADAGRDSVQVNGTEYDFDLVIRGTIDHRPLVVLGEVKSNVTLAEVKKFLLLTAKAASSLKQEVRTIFFGYRAEKAARDLIKDQGAYMVFTHGKLL